MTVAEEPHTPMRARCDRCFVKPAVREVECFYGCWHWQCLECSRFTEQERNT